MRGKILIVDTDESVRDSIETAVGQAPFDVQITTIPDDALSYIRKGKVDIVLVDQNSVAPDFLDRVAHDNPDIVRVVSSTPPYALFDRTKDTRLLTKPWEPGSLHTVLRDAMQHATVNFTAYLCMTMRPTPPAPIASEFQQTRPEPAPTSLSRRELEVQELLVQGFRASYIARKLSISVFTVRNHLKSIYRKQGVSSRTALVKPKRTPQNHLTTTPTNS